MINSTNAKVDDTSDYPLANTEATKMLSKGFEVAQSEKDLSQRAIAKMLGYKTSVVLSHMALGRVPIPIDRAPDFSRMLSLDHGKFLLAVLEQRHPDVNFMRILGVSAKRVASSKGGRESFVLNELESLAGKDLDDLTPGRVNLLREVVSDIHAEKRWLDLAEVSVMEIIRDKFPQGVTITDRKKLYAAISEI